MQWYSQQQCDGGASAQQRVLSTPFHIEYEALLPLLQCSARKESLWHMFFISHFIEEQYKEFVYTHKHTHTSCRVVFFLNK